MKELSHKISLNDLTKTKPVVIKLPTESRDFSGANSKSFGPSNSVGMGSAIGSVSGSSGGSVGYGNGSYGSGYYPEAIQKFSRFVAQFESIDSDLVNTIQRGLYLIFNGGK